MLRQFLSLALIVAPLPAWADDKPLIRPSRDVVVEYRFSGQASGPLAASDGLLTIHFASLGNRMRIELPGGRGHMIVDADAGHMYMVVPAKRMYMEMPADRDMLHMLAANNASFKKTGTDTVAGTKCTSYDASSNGHTGQVCLTDDGVLLRGRTGKTDARHELEAVKVTYGRQPATLFEPPPDFQKFELPAMSGGLPPGGAGGPPGTRGGIPGGPSAR